MKPDFNVQQHTTKMIDIWDAVAEGWHKWCDYIDEWTRDSTLKMIDEAEIRQGAMVLDVAAGNGTQSFLAAKIVGSDGHVLCTDVSENLLKFAQQTAEEKDYTQIETRYMEAENLEIEDQSIDAVICKNGLMLFGDKEKAISEIFRVLKPDGKFSAIVFSSPKNNPWMSMAGKMIMEATDIPPPKPGSPGLFSLHQPEVIENLLSSGGFVDISISKVGQELKVPKEIDFVKFLQEAPGMLVLMLRTLPTDKQEQVMNNIRQAFSQFQDDHGYVFPAEFLVLSGRKPKM